MDHAIVHNVICQYEFGIIYIVKCWGNYWCNKSLIKLINNNNNKCAGEDHVFIQAASSIIFLYRL